VIGFGREDSEDMNFFAAARFIQLMGDELFDFMIGFGRRPVSGNRYRTEREALLL